MIKKTVLSLGRSCLYIKRVFLALLPMALLLLASSCMQVREQGYATQSVAGPDFPLINTVTPAATIPPHEQPAATKAPMPSPTSTEMVSETPVANLWDENLPISAHAYGLPLTVRHVMTDSASLFFELDQPADGFLYYQAVSPLGQPVQEFPLAPGEDRQEINLEDLLPGTEYRAIVALKDEDGAFQQSAFQGEPWGSVHFHTATGQEPLRAGIFGDASFGDPATEALVQVMASYKLDFVIHTGDVVAEIQENSGPVEAYALKYYKTLSPLLHQLPIYTVIGNHDYDSAARWQDSYFYYYAFPPFPDPDFSRPKDDIQYYAFAYNDVQFLMLDSEVLFGISGRGDEEAWMAERLADPRFRFTIPVFHVPPFFSGAVHPTDQFPVRQFWHPVFVSVHVPLAFSGHSHHYERLEADGITYIVSGGGSGTLYAPGEILPESQEFARRTHFVLMEIYSDRIELSAIDKTGELFDQTVIPIR
jgi:predicted phosphodiesterase